MTTNDSTARIRKITIRLTIGSFSIAALLGILALLKGGEFSETQGNVLITTLLVGVVSIAVLCYLTTAGKRYQWVGILGGVSASVPTATGLILIWSNFDSDNQFIWKAFGVGTTLAATLAQVSLLLSLVDNAKPAIRKILYATLLFAAVVAGMIIVPIIFDFYEMGDWYWRLFGVIAILDVLGTVTVAALTKFGTSDGVDEVALTISPALDSRLTVAARTSGRSKGDIVSEALENFLDGFGDSPV